MAYISKEVVKVEKVKVTFKKAITRTLMVGDSAFGTISEEAYKDLSAYVKACKLGDEQDNSIWYGNIGIQRHGFGKGPEASYTLCLASDEESGYTSHDITFHDLKRLFRVR